MFTFEINVGDFTAKPINKIVDIKKSLHKEAYIIKHKNIEIFTIYSGHNSKQREEIITKLKLLNNNLNWENKIEEMKKEYRVCEFIGHKKDEIDMLIDKYGARTIEKRCQERAHGVVD